MNSPIPAARLQAALNLSLVSVAIHFQFCMLPVSHLPKHQRSNQETGHVYGLWNLNETAPVTHQIKLKTENSVKVDVETWTLDIFRFLNRHGTSLSKYCIGINQFIILTLPNDYDSVCLSCTVLHPQTYSKLISTSNIYYFVLEWKQVSLTSVMMLEAPSGVS